MAASLGSVPSGQVVFSAHTHNAVQPSQSPHLAYTRISMCCTYPESNHPSFPNFSVFSLALGLAFQFGPIQEFVGFPQEPKTRVLSRITRRSLNDELTRSCSNHHYPAPNFSRRRDEGGCRTPETAESLVLCQIFPAWSFTILQH